jgi:UDP-glucose 4-epimerase
MLKSIDQWGDAPIWTVDKIANATKDWFRYLGNDEKAASNPQQKASG